MEHIRQFDWCFSQPDIYFLKEDDLSKSVTEKILRNKFHDPFISSDSEEETPKINWDEVFTKKEILNREYGVYVPCLPKIQYPKVSALTAHQQYQILKVICADHPHILEQVFIPRPTKTDRRVFEELKPIYEKEQKEYMEWAKTLWTNVHCVRALRPKPTIETVYDARFKMRASEMESYPKTFNMAAQIPLESRSNTIELILEKELINVDIKALPQIECRPITKKLSIMKPCLIPEPCNKHPCRFILPNEKSVSILPYTEVQRELAQFAVDNGCQYIASENALRCLVEQDRSWDIPVSVCSVFGPDGETTDVVVLGNEFSINRESVLVRTYKAYKHLLQHTLLPPAEKKKLNYKNYDQEKSNQESSNMNVFNDMDVSSDDEDNGLCIDDNSQMSCAEESQPANDDEESEQEAATSDNISEKRNEEKTKTDNVEFYNCTCKDTMFELPPPRSFKKWRLVDRTTDENFSIVIHCSHKVRDNNGEVLLEPIPEYQLDLGGSEQSKCRIRSLALALHLRKNVSLLNVRIDGATGEVATFEATSADGLRAAHAAALPLAARALLGALAQLRGLLARRYVLRHEPGHGSNALLFAGAAAAGAALRLHFDCARAAADDELGLRAPPALCAALLPYHKYLPPPSPVLCPPAHTPTRLAEVQHRRMAPCAFTPHEQHVCRRAPRLRAARPPPRALQLGADAEAGGARAKVGRLVAKEKKEEEEEVLMV
ncbi:uncharacterized protein LOC125078001 [Vanessa atalanta]|uniref:uncharacterized protein LOC125078001 n=1 Tax=Vanessa atalanta TaxID=42275 RepID=UPI001FCD3AE9|nr:uncharacterized protein LOC125078001 [Vanessa atalanta]